MQSTNRNPFTRKALRIEIGGFPGSVYFIGFLANYFSWNYPGFLYHIEKMAKKTGGISPPV